MRESKETSIEKTNQNEKENERKTERENRIGTRTYPET